MSTPYQFSVLSYTFGVINWTEAEIKNADIYIRKNLNLYRMFQIKSDVDRLYVPRIMGGRGLMSLWDSFRCTMVRLTHFLNESTLPTITKCKEYDENSLFSITKKAEKFIGALEFPKPTNLQGKPVQSYDYQVSRKDLLYVLCYIRGFCQKDKGSAGADPKNYRGGSARFTMVLLAMIPKLVQRVLLHVFHLSRGFCQKDKGSASHDSQISRK